MARPARVSPERILAAAAQEFAARGYAGARVDHIARRAKVNKAMLYYHFGSKQALYRTLLRQTFSAAAARLRDAVAGPLPPARKVELLVSTFAAFVSEHAYFPAIMLREIAEGGAHLDRDTLAVLASLPAVVGDVVRDGAKLKALRPMHPVAAYFTIVAPIVLYLSGTPIRKALAAHKLADVAALTPELFIRQLQASVRLALVAPDRTDSTP